MTKGEYQELVEFIGVRFDRNDKRFDTMDERLKSDVAAEFQHIRESIGRP